MSQSMKIIGVNLFEVIL